MKKAEAIKLELSGKKTGTKKPGTKKTGTKKPGTKVAAAQKAAATRKANANAKKAEENVKILTDTLKNVISPKTDIKANDSLDLSKKVTE